MCCCDYDAPDVFDKRIVKAARKRHCCAECGRWIKVGESYEYVFGVWGGEARSFHTCRFCRAAIDAWEGITGCDCYAFSYLRDAISESSGDWKWGPGENVTLQRLLIGLDNQWDGDKHLRPIRAFLPQEADDGAR